MLCEKKQNTKCWKPFIYFLLMSNLLVSCQNEPEVRITGSIRNINNGTIVYRISTDGMFNPFTTDTLHIRPDSTFTLTLPAREYERIDFIWWGKAALGSVITKDHNIHLNIDASDKHHLSISGLDEKVIKLTQLLNQLDADVLDLRTRQGDRWQIAKDTVATSVSHRLKAYADSLEAQLDGLDESLQTKARQDIRMQLLLAFQNQTIATCYRASEATKKSWFAELDKMTDFCKINHPDSPFSPAFHDVASNEAGIRYFMRGEKLPDTIKQDYPNVLFYSYEHTLTGKAQEAAMALLFLEDQSREKFSPEIQLLNERFFELYPESSWRTLVQAAVAKNKAFNQITLSEDIHFLDATNVKTLKEITDLYKGKVIFMDIWATWCGPCRESFAFVKPLQDYAKEKDIVLLYLSIDRPEDEEKWKKMAVLYDLKGEHIRVQEAFNQEIYGTFGNNGALYIPHYVIIDKEGKIRYKTAASPEKMDELRKQLDDAGK